MKPATLNRTATLFRYVLLIFAIFYIFIYLYIVFKRIHFPFELEWQEGSSVDSLIRIISGRKLYVKPSLEYIPLIYTPLYFYISAIMAKITNIGFLPLRLVSFISSLGSFLVIFLIVKKETRSSFSGILASGLFAATFRIGGGWFDIARVDSLFLFFFLIAFYLIRFGESSISDIGAGIFISLSFFTKQTALMMCIPIMLYYVIFYRRRSIFFIGTVTAIIGLTSFALNYLHDGWYKYYIFDIPKQHLIEKKLFISFWVEDIMLPLSMAFAISIYYLMFAKKINSNKKDFFFYFFAVLGMVGGALLSRMHTGGYNNVLFPAYAIISILFGLGISLIYEFIQATPINKKKLVEIGFYIACIIQFISLRYDFIAQIPTQEDLLGGKMFINFMKKTKGEILVPSHSYLPTLAGKKSHAHDFAIHDILRGRGQVRDKLFNEIKLAIKEKRFSTIILDSQSWLTWLRWFQDDMEKHYILKERIFNDSVTQSDPDSEDWFNPVTGMPTRPDYIYVPK